MIYIHYFWPVNHGEAGAPMGELARRGNVSIKRGISLMIWTPNAYNTGCDRVPR